MSAAGIACALAFLAVPGVRHLPRIEAGRRRRPVAFPPVADTGNGERRRRPAILAVDDEPAVLAAVARDLRRGVRRAATGSCAPSSGRGGARDPARARRARRPGGAAGGRPAHARAGGHRVPRRRRASIVPERQARAADRLRRHRGGDPGDQRGRAGLLPAQAVGSAGGAALPGRRGPADDVGGRRGARVRRRARSSGTASRARLARAARLPGAQPRARRAGSTSSATARRASC